MFNVQQLKYANGNENFSIRCVYFGWIWIFEFVAQFAMHQALEVGDTVFWNFLDESFSTFNCSTNCSNQITENPKLMQ